MYYAYTIEYFLAPDSLMLFVVKGVIHLAVNITSSVVGLFILYVGFALIYCLASQRWTDFFIFCIVGAAVIGILFLIVILEEAVDAMREKIREI